ncbi:hypothetical protein HPB47_008533 [Ixodes persulcatus]|uniref:Uncharacterized protein n=1 Tax=Ixodes persulcatus TaxID=34615 RepID=A0AC60P4J2_IXOPE|nr:hypothetical protein HPB47_008533 [Ixodes persulcatus]
MVLGQLKRLSRSDHGRVILQKLEKTTDLDRTTIAEHPPPPWETEDVSTSRPIPQNQGKDHKKRRQHQSEEHLKKIEQLGGDTDVFYTDAARNEAGRTCIAWSSPTGSKTWRGETYKTSSSKTAELLAILQAVKEATDNRQRPNVIIYTDSQEALRECKRCRSQNDIALQIRSVVKKSKPYVIVVIDWIPGHEGIPGNERANEAAMAQLNACTLPSQGHDPLLATQEQDERPDIPPDPDEIKREERLARKLRLISLLPPDSYPIPPEYNRWEEVSIRRLQTNTAITPIW